MWLQNQNPFSSSFPWQELPSISLPADYSGNSCRAFPCFFFFFWLVFCGERSLPRRQLERCLRAFAVWPGHRNNGKTATSVSHMK